MKSIVSGGGPLIAMHPSDLRLWGGVDSLIFFRNKSSREDDYQAVCDVGSDDPYQVIDLARGSDLDILMLTMPLRTFIMKAGLDYLYIAQIETAEKGWSDDDLCASDFERATDWKDPIKLFFKKGPIIIFDSACVEFDLRDYAILTADLSEGMFVCDWSEQFWPGRARMNFIRLVKQQI